LLSKKFREAEMVIDPKPRTQFIINLQAWLEQKSKDGYGIIFNIDANEELTEHGQFSPLHFQLETPILMNGHDGTLSTLYRTCGLVDPLTIFHPDQPPPATYSRGQKRIDFILVSTYLMHSTERARVLLYGTIFTGDHRPCSIDLNGDMLFNEITPKMGPPTYCGLNSDETRISQKYIEILMKQIEYHKLDKKMLELQKVAEEGNWT